MEDVTSSHTYQKGSWTLHMLRGVLGSAAFQRGIRAYYATHFNSTATTADFRRAMEEASGQELGWFFEQWLYQPGTLKIDGSWRYEAAAKQLRITLNQTPTDGRLFTMPIEVGVFSNGQPVPTVERLRVTEQRNVFTLSVPSAPDSVRLDPNMWVLMDATFTRQP